MDGKTARQKLLMPSLMIITAGLLLGAAVGPGAQLTGSIGGVASDDPDKLIIAAGTVREVSDTLEAASIVVAGTIQHTGDGPLRIEADSIRVLDGGSILARNGAPGKHALFGNDPATAGGPGADIWIDADELIVQPGGIIQAGSGGAGGAHFSLTNATAMPGGDGGSIFAWASHVDVAGALLPGRGGDGGHALALAFGNGTNHASRGGDAGDSGETLLRGQRFMTTSSAATIPEVTLAPRFDKLARLVDQVGLPLPADVSLLDIVDLDCQPQGTPGANSDLGDGGDGGDGCSSSSGDSGANGAHGNSGAWGCTAGGPGAPGASATSPASSGGKGGEGFQNGGNGGSATSRAKGGTGGAGGNGGKATFGSDCPGGTGGQGGAGTAGAAIGGDGGNGLCGSGGAGGTASSEAEGGAGGPGGSGNPAGVAGVAGPASSNGSSPGRGGAGADVC